MHLNRILSGLSLVCLMIACGLATSVHAEDWPEFRGPTKQGQVIGRKLPIEWSQEHAIQWRSELPGEGWSSPIVVGQSIYLTTAIPIAGRDDQFELALLILDAKSGAITKQQTLFTQDDAAPRIHSKNSHASPTPVFDGTRIYVHFGHQGTACVTTDGDVVWKNDSLGYSPVHGNGGSPVVIGSLLIFSRDGADISQVIALDKNTGNLVWEAERNVEADRRFSFCTPLLLEIDGRQQLIFPGSNVVQSLDPSSGEEIWRLRYEGYSVIPRPIYESGLVFICTGYDRPSLLAIDPTGSGDVTETHLRWRETSGIAHTPSLIGENGRVTTVSDNGIATCFDAKTGKELWKERIGGNFSASPLLVDNRMYLLSEEGDCTVLDISGKPQVIAENKMGERCLASMATVDNDLLLRSAFALYRIGK